jgi:outer membrane protein assembly factor BamE (lipoprotein component of BamABCDE complex)
LRLPITLILLAATAACSPIRTHQGYLGDKELMDSIKPGVDNKTSVAKTLGRPSIRSQWDDREWYYVSRLTRQYAFRMPRPESQEVLVVQFDEKGNVTRVGKRGLELAANVAPETDKTKTVGKERSFFEALFGNIGRVGSIGQGPGGDQDNTGGGGGGPR